MTKSNASVIGLIGARGAGKTTVFSLMSELFPCREIMLARRLKVVCAGIVNVPIDNFELPQFKEEPFKSGAHMITVRDLRMITQLFDVSFTAFEAELIKHVGKRLHTPREAAQYIGTEVLRSIQHDIHCDFAGKLIGADMVNVVTDIRFVDEYQYFVDRFENFQLIHIFNPYAEDRAASDAHPSERGLDELKVHADIVITNVGTLDDLAIEVAHAFISP